MSNEFMDWKVWKIILHMAFHMILYLLTHIRAHAERNAPSAPPHSSAQAGLINQRGA